VRSVAVFGSGRFQVGAIILPPADQDSDSQAYRDGVWRHIELAVNPIIPKYARIVRPLLLFAINEKSFLLTDKDTLKMQATLAQYADAINEAYFTLQSGDADAAALLPAGTGFQTGDHAAIAHYIAAVASAALGRPLGEHEDFFLAGGDSMMAIRIAASLAAALRRSGVSTRLPENIVYSSPTIAALTQFIEKVLLQDLSLDSRGHVELGPAETVENTLRRHRQSLCALLDVIDRQTHVTIEDSACGLAFAITGTTGSLGVFLVSLLLRNPSLNRLYLLHRKHAGVSAQEMHERAFTEKGLNYMSLRDALNDGRAVFVEVDVSKRRFGVDSETYAKVRLLFPKCARHYAYSVYRWHRSSRTSVTQHGPSISTWRSSLSNHTWQASNKPSSSHSLLLASILPVYYLYRPSR
jgi:hypothetical protein